MEHPSSNRPFVPGFLKKLDRKLLMRYPETWSSRFHLVWWYAGLTNLVIASFYLLTNWDLLSQPNQAVWAFILSIFSLIGIVMWLRYLLRFNVFKRFGIISPGQTLLTFLLYLSNCSVIVSFPFIPKLVDTIHSEIVFPKKQLIEDVNNINTCLTALEMDRFPTYWERDTVISFFDENYEENKPADEFSNYNQSEISHNEKDSIYDETQDRKIEYYKLSIQEIESRIKNSDSVIKISEQLYVVFETPDAQFCSIANGYQKDVWKSGKIYREAQKLQGKSKIKIKWKLNTLLNKYRTENTNFFAGLDDSEFYLEDIGSKYDFKKVQNGLQNLAMRKGLTIYTASISFVSIFYYLSVVLAISIFVFRHSTTKAFFLSFLYGFIVFVFIGFTMSFILRGNYLENSAYYVLYFMILCFILLMNRGSITRSTNNGVVLNLFTMHLSFYPLILFQFLTELNEWMVEENGVSTMVQFIPLSIELKTSIFTIIQYAQLPFFLLCIYFFLHDLYKRWYALPEA